MRAEQFSIPLIRYSRPAIVRIKKRRTQRLNVIKRSLIKLVRTLKRLKRLL